MKHNYQKDNKVLMKQSKKSNQYLQFAGQKLTVNSEYIAY